MTTQLNRRERVALKRIYYDVTDPGGFGGIQKLLRAARRQGLTTIDAQKAKAFLDEQATYQKHKAVRKRFERDRIMSYAKNDLWQADLADMQLYRQRNDGYAYILVVVDTFSKVAYARPTKTKTGAEMAKAFSGILRQARPQFLFTDKVAWTVKRQ